MILILLTMDDVREETAAHDPGLVLFSGDVSTATEFAEATRLYRHAFHYDLPHLSLNANLLSALGRNGGSAIGIRRDAPDGPMVGFAYGFSALDPDTHESFHYSQAAVVHPDLQGKGIGRLLKLRQAEVARSWGAGLMRWGYNPLFARNGHFNLDSLGGTGRKFVIDYYGRPHSDRLLVEWDLDDGTDPHAAEHDRPIPGSIRDADPAIAVPDGDGVWIPIPSGLVADNVDDAGAQDVRDTLRQTLREVTSHGLALVSCRRLGPDISVYRAVPDQEAA